MAVPTYDPQPDVVITRTRKTGFAPTDNPAVQAAQDFIVSKIEAGLKKPFLHIANDGLNQNVLADGFARTTIGDKAQTLLDSRPANSIDYLSWIAEEGDFPSDSEQILANYAENITVPETLYSPLAVRKYAYANLMRPSSSIARQAINPMNKAYGYMKSSLAYQLLVLKSGLMRQVEDIVLGQNDLDYIPTIVVPIFCGQTGVNAPSASTTFADMTDFCRKAVSEAAKSVNLLNDAVEIVDTGGDTFNQFDYISYANGAGYMLVHYYAYYAGVGTKESSRKSSRNIKYDFVTYNPNPMFGFNELARSIEIGDNLSNVGQLVYDEPNDDYEIDRSFVSARYVASVEYWRSFLDTHCPFLKNVAKKSPVGPSDPLDPDRDNGGPVGKPVSGVSLATFLGTDVYCVDATPASLLMQRVMRVGFVGTSYEGSETVAGYDGELFQELIEVVSERFKANGDILALDEGIFAAYSACVLKSAAETIATQAVLAEAGGSILYNSKIYNPSNSKFYAYNLSLKAFTLLRAIERDVVNAVVIGDIGPGLGKSKVPTTKENYRSHSASSAKVMTQVAEVRSIVKNSLTNVVAYNFSRVQGAVRVANISRNDMVPTLQLL